MFLVSCSHLVWFCYDGQPQLTIIGFDCADHIIHRRVAIIAESTVTSESSVGKRAMPTCCAGAGLLPYAAIGAILRARLEHIVDMCVAECFALVL